MDAYEATRIVFSRVQNLDPENASKIMGLLLIQDHGEKEMIRLAFGPEALLHSVVVKARKDLGLLPSSSPATPSGPGVGIFSRHSARFHPTSPFAWAAAVPFSVVEDFSQPEELPPPSPAYGGDLIGDFKLQNQLSFLDDVGGGPPIRAKSGDYFYPEIAGDCGSPSSGGESVLLPNSVGWGPNRRCGSIADLCLSSSEPSCGGFGWRPCLYFARGYCKNGNACRFFHDEATAASGKMDAVFDQELLLRSKSSRLMAFAAPIPYPPTSILPPSPSSPAKYMNFLLQHQNDSQRAAAAAATAAALMLNGGAGNEELHKFMGRPRADFAGISNAGSRQIYLTFPADSSFREEDVSNYFSIYGPVQDVRIPYQQKRMFGFVTFVYPETVKLILAKGNPHFVCDARVLVKPYKEKGKVLDKYRKQPQPQPDRLSFSGCSTLTDPDSPFDLGGKMSYNMDSGGNMGDAAQDASLLRRLMEEQQQAELLQQAIDLQGRRFELMDLKTRNFASAALQNTPGTATLKATMASSPCNGMSSPVEGKSSNTTELAVISADDKEETAGEPSPKENTHFQESTEHNLPDSPFASSTETSSFSDRPFSAPTAGFGVISTKDPIGTPLLPPSSALSSCFFQMPARFSSGHGAVGM